VIGTHALLEEKVEFARPGLVICRRTASLRSFATFEAMRKSGESSDGRKTTAIAETDAPEKNLAEPDVLVIDGHAIPRTWL